MFKPSLSKKSNRRLYLKGWYYEQAAKKIIYKKLFDAGLRSFIIKAPYGYPFDLVSFIAPNWVYFFEVRFTYKNSVYIPSRKLEKTLRLIKGYKGFFFKYFVIAFKGSVRNYKIIEVELKKGDKKIII
jgi:Holliday junction resolvase